MKTPPFPVLGALAVLTLCLGGCDPGAPGKTDAGRVDFVNDVKPILQTQCVRCHHDQAIMGGLNLMSRELALRGSNRGPVLIPGDPEKSPLYRVTLLPEEQDHAMPATGAKLTAEEKEIIRRWIQEGADWPEGPEGRLAPVDIEVRKA